MLLAACHFDGHRPQPGAGNHWAKGYHTEAAELIRVWADRCRRQLGERALRRGCELTRLWADRRRQQLGEGRGLGRDPQGDRGLQSLAVLPVAPLLAPHPQNTPKQQPR